MRYRKNNYLSALGQTKGSMVSVNLIANTDLRTPEEFRQLVVKAGQGSRRPARRNRRRRAGRGELRSGRPLQRRDGDVHGHLGAADRELAGSDQEGSRGAAGDPGADAARHEGGIPYDSTEYIQDAINEVLHTLTETLLIVIIVIFLFLGSMRSVLIPIVAIPISLIGAVFLMLVAGFTINLLTLLAIVLSVGLVVDDAIVMVENVERHLQMGKPPMQAAIDAARELVGPIIAMTITLAAVYAPVGIQGGLTGALFREFAFTLAGAVIVSGSRRADAVADDGFEAAARRRYRAWLRRLDQSPLRERASGLHSHAGWHACSYRPVVLALWAIVVAADRAVLYVLAARTGAGRRSGSRLRRHPGSANSTHRSDQAVHDQVYDVYHSFPESGSIFQITTPSGGFGGMVTKPWSQRKKTAQQLLVESVGPLSKIPGIRVIPLTPPPLPGGGNFPSSS